MTAALETAAVEELGAGLLGDPVDPGHSGYDEARVIWNGHIDRRVTVPRDRARCTWERLTTSAPR